MKVQNIYDKYDNVLILHGLSKNGPLNKNPDVKLIEQIPYIQKKENLHCFSIFESKVTNLFSNFGLILKDAEIIHAFFEDSGLDSYDTLAWNDSLLEHIINKERVEYNDIIVKNAEIIGFYSYEEQHPNYNWLEILDTCNKLYYPLFFLNKNFNLMPTIWNGLNNKFNSSEIVKPFKQILTD